MPYTRRLPSGKWQATVRRPDGKRITKTNRLKSVVNEWGRELEAQFARGDLRDPRAGHITVTDWHQRWIAARGIEAGTRDKLESVWRTHCDKQWGAWPMDAITVMEAQEWVRVLERKRRARHNGRPVAVGEDSPELAATTVHAAVHLMSSMYVSAMRERPPLVLGNPFHGLDLPTVPPAPTDFFDHDEANAILDALSRLRPHEPQWRLIVEIGTWMGLRPGEMFGLAGDRVDWLRRKVHVTRVMTRHGLREYPKSRKSHRVVPMSRDDMTDNLSRLLRDRDALIFTRPMGGPVDDTFFRHRIWVPAIKAAGVRPLPPRAMRHTAASWLVQDGVPLYDVQALLGHESFATTQRYAHLRPDAHEKVTESWRRTADARRSRKIGLGG